MSERRKREDELIKMVLSKASNEIREEMERERNVIAMRINRLEYNLQQTFTEEQAEMYKELSQARTEYTEFLNEIENLTVNDTDKNV